MYPTTPPLSPGEVNSSADDDSMTTDEESTSLSTSTTSTPRSNSSLVKRRKGAKAWVYLYLFETDDAFECRLCKHDSEIEKKLVWTKEKKLQSGNVARHLERKHKPVLIADGIVEASAEDIYSSEELYTDLME